MIGNCDNCDRRNVPVSPGEACGVEGVFCFICRGDSDPDPFGEMEPEPINSHVAEPFRSILNSFFNAPRRL